MKYETAEERHAKKFFAINHYHVLGACCGNCRFVEAGYEGEFRCLKAAPSEEWNVGDVDPSGICDSFEEEIVCLS